METYSISNTVGITMGLSKDWLDNGSLRTSFDLPVFTDSDNEYDYLSSKYIKEHNITRLCIYYNELGENDESHIHEIRSIDLPVD